ncbi:MAG: TIGR02391 family protein [Candidatus Pacebacteria bacterium]|nr:TIGR02391 family protein [Candidatus Paceibacterota bacterium]
MTNKRSQYPGEVPPSLSKEQGQSALSAMKEKGDQILKSRPIAEATFDTWSQSAFEYIKKTFGSESGHLRIFSGQSRVSFGQTSEHQIEQDRAKSLQHRISVLVSLIEQLETEIKLEAPAIPSASSTEMPVWSLLHPKVVVAAKARFEAGQYADCVEATMKDLNSAVKALVKTRVNQEFDGADLMCRAFSPSNPIIVLDDQTTESGQNQQKGFMQIFAGAMTGIRNPKAHENLTITKERAIHHLFLASLLFHRLDERR